MKKRRIVKVAFDTYYKLQTCVAKGLGSVARVDFAALADAIQQTKDILGQYSDSSPATQLLKYDTENIRSPTVIAIILFD